jgi:hypothetical protein
METGFVSKEIKEIIVPTLNHVDSTIKRALDAQMVLKENLERTLKDLQNLYSDMEQKPLDQVVVRCAIARKRILNIQRKIGAIHLRLQKHV